MSRRGLLLLVNVCIFFAFSLTVALAAAAVLLGARKLQGNPPPRYYASITSADLNLTRPWFELSLGVASPRGFLLRGGGYCLERGMAVQVSYRGAPLAGEVVSSSEAICTSWWSTPPRKTVWTRIVAVGNNNTRLPEFLVDALASDTQRGVSDFDVSIWTADGKMAAWCGARRVGHDDDKAAAECHAQYNKYLD